MKILFVYPRFRRHAECHPELLDVVPMNEYLGSPSLGIACLAAVTPPGWDIELRDDRVAPADHPTDADVVALSFFTPAATRAFELAHYFRALGKRVVAGGIFPTMMPEATAPHVDSVVIGEGEAIWPSLLEDIVAGRPAPRYRSVDPIDVTNLPPPRVDVYLDAEHATFRPDDYPVQLSRGCPLSCHACVLPTSMTRELRLFPIEHVLAQLDRLSRAGKLACLTEDTSWLPGRASRHLAELLDRLIERGERAPISYIGTSMPMLLHAPSALLEQAKRAGVDMFYLVCGFDPISMKAFTGRDVRAQARAELAIARARDAGIEPYTSFLLGLDDDDDGTVDRMLEFTHRTGLRKAEFALFTPYPGTPSWRRLLAEGRILHRRWADYNDANVVFRPARMTPDRLQSDYLRIWREFYADKASLAALPREQRTIQF